MNPIFSLLVTISLNLAPGTVTPSPLAGDGNNLFHCAQQADEGESTRQDLEKALQRPVSIQLGNAPFDRGVKVLEFMAKLDIEVQLEHLRDPATGLLKLPHVNLKAKNIPAREVLDRMCKTAGVQWKIVKGQIVVQDPAK